MSLYVILASELFWLHVIIVFLFGALLGSFFNVCIYRMPLGQSVNKPSRSFCPACGTMIDWYDNIPLLSYLQLRGICRHCGAKFSSRYFWIELLTAVLFTAVFWTHRYTLATPVFLLLTSFLIVATFTDLDHWIIPDSISLGGAAAGLALMAGISLADAVTDRAALGTTLPIAIPFAQLGPWRFIANAAAGAVFGYLLLWFIGVVGTLVFRKEAMGMGDMKLFACIGAFFGWHGCLLVLAMASFIGAILGLSLIAAQWIVERLAPGQSSAAVQAAGAGSVESAADTAESPGPNQAPGEVVDSNPEPTEESVDSPEPPTPARRLHHLPFGPYIAIAAYIFALYYEPILKALTHYFYWGGAF